MAKESREHDVVVLGAGPAGSAVAILLARRGYDVGLVRPDDPHAAELAESVPPSGDRLLAELDVLGDLERSGAQSNRGNTVWWADADARVESFEQGRAGVHLSRGRLETVLEARVRAAGVTVHAGIARDAGEGPGGWMVGCELRGQASLTLRAGWLLDATGRRGVVAAGEGREHDRSTTTIALVRRWRRDGGFAGADPEHTLVESYEDGWAWSVPLGPEIRSFTVMVDPRFANLSRKALDRTLDRELEKAPRIAGCLEGATPVGAAWACPASLYTSSRFGRRGRSDRSGLLLVGDAGSFIDPLSSFGVKKALSSGWLAAAAVHTCLADPPTAETAVEFFDARERAIYRSYRSWSASFFEACAEVYGHEYWSDRAIAAGAAAEGMAAASEPEAHGGGDVPKERARDALDRIRARPDLGARRGASVRILKRAAVMGQRIALVDHLASERLPTGIRWVRNVDLARVVEVAPRHPAVPDGWEEYNAGAPPVSLPDYLAALATAFAAGLLEHDDST